MRRVRLVTHGFSWAFLVFFLGWCALFMLRYRDAVFSAFGLRHTVPILGLVVLVAGLVFVVIRRVPGFERHRLGIEAEALHFAVPGWTGSGFGVHRGHAPWAEVYFDGARLLAGRRLILVAVVPWGKLFAASDLAAVVAHVPKSNMVSPSELGRIAIMVGAIKLWVIIPLLALAILLVFGQIWGPL